MCICVCVCVCVCVLCVCVCARYVYLSTSPCEGIKMYTFLCIVVLELTVQYGLSGGQIM